MMNKSIGKCKLKSANWKVQIGKCKLKIANWKVQIENCKLESANWKVQIENFIFPIFFFQLFRTFFGR